jgi:hypothetical protein
MFLIFFPASFFVLTSFHVLTCAFVSIAETKSEKVTFFLKKNSLSGEPIKKENNIKWLCLRVDAGHPT